MDSSRVHFFTINNNDAGQRVDNFIRKRYPNLPKRRIYQMLRKGEVRVNKKRVKPATKLQSNDLLRMPPVIDGKQSSETVPAYWLEKIKNSLLYEDDDFLIINKPAGISVHGGTGQSYGVIDVAKQIWGQEQVELAHRLDRATSGCLVLGKHRHALVAFQQAMQNNMVSKIYDCLVKGPWLIDGQWLELLIEKDRGNVSERMRISDTGKLARTYFKIEQTFLVHPYTLFLLKVTLDTGRTHQIRVSVESQHSAIAGDQKYGDVTFNRWLKDKGYYDLFLHAHSIEFSYNNQPIYVTASLPDSAKNLLNLLQ